MSVRLNIFMDPANARDGYTNTPPDSLGDILPGEADEVLALDVLEYLPLDKVDIALTNWCDLVSVGGAITVSCADLHEVAAALDAGRIGHSVANLILHGKQERGWDLKRANYGIGQLASALEARGLRVVRKVLKDMMAVVTAKKD